MKQHTSNRQSLRSLRPRNVVLIGALLIAVVAAGGWYFSRATQAPNTGVSQTVQVNGLHLTLQFDQNAPDARVVDLSVKDASGAPVEVQQARMRFWMSEMDMGTVEVEPSVIDKGHLQARGQFFSMAGHWNIDTIVTQSNGEALQTSFRVPIGVPGEEIGPSNPLQADTQTVLAGQRLYLTNCVPCHGASGRGDGPAGVTLNPRPSNFTDHMTIGKHTDGQVFLWIKNGYPNSAMPAWDQRLSETDMWQLVAYLRTFGKTPPEQAARATPIPTLAAGAQPTPPPVGPQPAPTTPPAGQTPPAAQLAPDMPQPLPPMIFTRNGNLWRGDGTNAPTQMTRFTPDTWAEYPMFSPDGTRIAFVAISQPPVTATVPLPTSALYVTHADGSDMRALWKPAEGLFGLPAWLPDGQSLYVAANGINKASGSQGVQLIQIIKVDVATGAQMPILNDALDPAISRDGTRLAFLHLEKDGYTMSLNVAALDGSGARTIAGGAAFQSMYAPRFAPDGQRIVFAAIGGPDTDPQGNPKISATPTSWSPLDALAALLAPTSAEAHGAPWDLWSVNVDGSGLRRLTSIYEDTPMAAFSPDGAQMAVMGAGGIYLMNADGSQVRRIDRVGDHGGLDWARK